MKLPVILKWVIIHLVILLYTLNGFSSEQERYLHFTETEGLPRNITICLEQDHYGYLWIGTTNGIARYDGKDFYSYKELSGVGVVCLHYDSRNILWAGTDKGLYQYNRMTNYFELKSLVMLTKSRKIMAIFISYRVRV